MNFTNREAAHRAWVADYKTRGSALNQYQAFMRGYNEGAAAAVEASLPQIEPVVPTIDAVRQHFCEMDRASRMSWFMDSVTKFVRRV